MGLAVVVLGIHHHGQMDILEVGLAIQLFGLFACAAQSRHQDTHEYRYDGNDHQEFNQGKGLAPLFVHDPFLSLSECQKGMPDIPGHTLFMISYQRMGFNESIAVLFAKIRDPDPGYCRH